MAKFKAHDSGWLLMPVLPLIVALIGIFLISLDRTPEVTHFKARDMPGYQPTAEHYGVEASPHKKWKDYAGSNGGLIVLGFVVAVGASFAYLVYVRRKGGDGEGSWPVLLITWGVGLALIFGGYVVQHGGLNYITDLSLSEFNQYRNNLDALFPIKK